MTGEDRRATVAYDGGGKTVSFNLTVMQFILTLVIGFGALSGMLWGVAGMFTRTAIREWWRAEGGPRVEKMIQEQERSTQTSIDSKVISAVDNRIETIRKLVVEANTLSATNSAILIRIETDVRELRLRVEKTK